MLVISPHLDDAVFSCGQVLAAFPGSTVVTVFAGLPDEDMPLTEWDARCGYASSRETALARREEDRRALGLLAARHVWLDFLDSQYGHTPTPDVVADALCLTLREFDVYTVALPMGLFHSDHLLTHEATMQALRGMRDMQTLLLYEDAPYRGRPGVLQERLAELATMGFQATPSNLETPVGDDGMKATAVAAYASQLRALGPISQADLVRPERLWELQPPPHWQALAL